MKKRKSIYAILTLIIAGFIYTQQGSSIAKSTVVDKDGSFDVEFKTDFNFLPSSTTNQIIKHKYYTLSYNEKHEQAEWTAYALTPQHIKRIDRTRPYFIYDKQVKTRSANYRNYKKSGYDKGHLVPAGDMRFSLDAYNDTFFTSNISPQNHKFNAGIWNTLEQKTRYWAQKYGKIYVITGGVLKEGLRTIGDENVSVPNEFYKILLDYTEPEIKAIAFLMPNENVKKALYKYVVSIDYIEEKTGIDFFPALPDAIENALESSNDYKAWSFR
ncbi:MAG: DNA/RNA non-specific endonuclease [Flavobacteriaceae bacterium]